MTDEDLEKQLSQLADLAETDKEINITELVEKTLAKKYTNQSYVPTNQRRWAYILSLVFPPLGLYFAARFFFSDKKDALDNAAACIVLVCISVVIYGLAINAAVKNPIFNPEAELEETIPTEDIDYDPSSQ
jgi:hypothetical protein